MSQAALAPRAPVAIFTHACRNCGKQRHPKEFVGNPVIGYCWHCYEWHQHAIEVFTGAPPRGCQECGRTYDELERLVEPGDGGVRLAFFRKDGIYQVLGVRCGCADAYERKRLDMFASTPYGERKKLRGAK